MVFVRSFEVMLGSCSTVMDCPSGIRILLAVLICHEIDGSLLVTNPRSPFYIFYCAFNLLSACSLACAAAFECLRLCLLSSISVSVCICVCTLERCLYTMFTSNFVYMHVLVCIDAYVRMYLFMIWSVDRSHPSIYLLYLPIYPRRACCISHSQTGEESLASHMLGASMRFSITRIRHDTSGIQQLLTLTPSAFAETLHKVHALDEVGNCEFLQCWHLQIVFQAGVVPQFAWRWHHFWSHRRAAGPLEGRMNHTFALWGRQDDARLILERNFDRSIC